jgi:hypothetical protein
MHQICAVTMRGCLVSVTWFAVLFAGLPAQAAPGGYPPLAGTYRETAEHPRVFTTPAGMKSLVARINVPGAFSGQIFSKFAAKVAAGLAAPVDWDAVYSGCDLDVYLHAFSYEPMVGYADAIRSADQLRPLMDVKGGMSPPRGAAIVAARLALYAALVKGGARPPAGGPPSSEAAALAKRILLNWAGQGFRHDKVNFLKSAEQFCDNRGQFSRLYQNGVGLQIARGIIYSVHAQDLLQSIDVLNADETARLNIFHTAMFDLIREASNFRVTVPELNRPDTVCELYSNHAGSHLIGLLSAARLLNDRWRFMAVLYGADRTMPLAIPWTKWFDHAVYGENDKPIACYKNKGPDRLTSAGSFQTSIVAPGEIEDRYRNGNPGQAFGYTLGVLAGLFDMCELMQNAGFDAFGYRGTHRQSIEMAAQYYACYGKYVGFKKTVTVSNARVCPDYQQYIGQIVSGLELNIVMGAYRFPNNTLVTELEAEARAQAGPDLLDPIRFGRWRD